MHAEFGSPVVTRDGKPLGTIEWLILDPETRRVREVAVRRGFFRNHGCRIALGSLNPGGDDRLHLNVTAGELRGLPGAHDGGEAQPGDVNLSPVSEPTVVWSADDYIKLWRQEQHELRPTELKAILSQQNVDHAIIDAGSDVFGREGHKVGELRQATFDVATGRLGSVIFHAGHLPGEQWAIPGEHVGAIADGSIYLDLNADEIRQQAVEQR